MTRERARQLAEELVGRMTVEEKAGQLRFDAPAIESQVSSFQGLRQQNSAS